jgi:D-psicose/D-tagatose/L-ribulose 3-epimerase
MRTGILCGVADLVDAAAGFDFAELSVNALLLDEDEAAFAALQARVLAAPLPVEVCCNFVPPRFRLTGPDADPVAAEAHMAPALRRAAALGARLMVFGSGKARRAPEGYPIDKARGQFLRVAARAAQLAADVGITVVLEPLAYRECNLLNFVSQAVAMAEEVGHPHLQVLADMYHMQCVAEPLTALAAAGAHLRHVHIDTPLLPGIAGGRDYDYPAFLAALQQAGYTGRISVEDHSGMLTGEQTIPRREVFRRLREYIAAALPV